MGNNLKYRIANVDDLEQLKSVGISAYGEVAKVLSPENQDRMTQNVSNDKVYIDLMNISTCFVCEIDDNIVGMAFYIPSGNAWEHFTIDMSYIRFVGVNPDYQGLGIGKKLTEMCIEKAIQTKEKVITLHTSEKMDAARHLYEKLGFKILNELEPKYGIRYWLYTMNLFDYSNIEFNFDNYLLRQIKIEDVNSFYNLMSLNYQRFIKYNPISAKSGKDYQTALETVKSRIEKIEKNDMFSFVIKDKTNENLIGNINLFEFDWKIPKCEIGYYIDKDYEGKGIMSNCLSLVSNFAFEKLKVNKIIMRIAEANIASTKVAEKNGFKIEGYIRNDFRTGDGDLIDMLYYGKIRK